MRAGQKKSLAKWGNDVFSQFKRKVKSHNVFDSCSSRRMRRLAKKKGFRDESIDASRNYVRDFKDFIDN